MAAPAAGQKTGREPAASNRITGSRRRWAFGAVLLAQFTTALTGTIVSTAAPTIADDLRGLQLYGWIFTAFMLSSAVAIPIVGKLSDVYGRRPFYALGILSFLAGTGLCGLSQNMPELIAARLLAGFGGGACLSLAATTVGDIFSPIERGRWLGVISSGWGLGNIAGPLVGGLVTDHFGWRWVFFLSLPPGLVALGLLLWALPRVRRGGATKVDLTGIGLLALGVVPLLLALSWGGVDVAWNAPWLDAMMAGSLIVLAIFVAHELRAPAAIISPRLFSVRAYTLIVILSVLAGTLLYSTIAFLPTYAQAVMGMGAQQSGLLLTPFIVSFTAGSALGGQLTSRSGRYRRVLITGVLLTLAGEAFILAGGPRSLALTVAGTVILGLGVGATFPITNVVGQSAHPYPLLGTVNATRQFFVNLNSVLTISLMSTVLVNSLAWSLSRPLPASARAVVGGGASTAGGLLSSRGQAALAARLGALPDGAGAPALAAVHAGLAAGLEHVFQISLAVSLVALGVAFLVPEIRLRTTIEDPAPAATM